jgi:predicted CXXCH cytochrome family protein
MKKILVVAVVLAIALMGASAAMANIAGSKHDLTSSTQTVKATAPTISSCQFCHTPHRADTSVANTPLWNKSMSTQTYSLYGGGVTLAGTTVNAPGPNSKTCLSCHDGSLSVGNVITGGTQTITAVAGRVLATGLLDPTSIYTIGANNKLDNDHPVGVQVAAGGGVAGLDTLAGMKVNSFKFYGVSTNMMECATCHDPHMTTNLTFLRRPNAQLCSLCHVNK